MKRISIILECIVLLVVGILVFTNQSQKQILVEEGTKNENTSLVFMLQEEDGTYSKSDSLPSSGYSFNATKSVCSNGATPTWEDNRLYLNNLTSNGTSCYLYFDVMVAAEVILASSKVNEGTPDFSQVATTDEGMYKAEDDLGTSYYFRGAVENNYLKFAGYWWRIIRINGNGSIRLIYDGISAHANGESSSDRQAGTSAYNSSYNQSYYVGYTYEEGLQRPTIQNSGTPSTIKGVLDSWYTTNIINKGYDDNVVSSPGFCNDRNLQSVWGDWVSSGVTQYYAAWERLYTNKTPTLQCSNELSDLYTLKIGLITADEVAMAGGVYVLSNGTYYLYTGNPFWTMSSVSLYVGSGGSLANVFEVTSTGQLGDYYVNGVHGVRPVINLSADVSLTGTGTMDDPYVVEGAE